MSKSPYYAIQTILHALFLPTPYKQAQLGLKDDGSEPTEILKPGALYSDCSVVRLRLPVLPPPAGASKSSKSKDADLPDDKEIGGQETGRLVWESYEQQLKTWDKKEPQKKESAESAKDK